MRRFCIVIAGFIILLSLFIIFDVFAETFSASDEMGDIVLPLDDYSRLLDLRNFEFLSLSECGGRFLVAVVHSAPENFFHRNAIRSTWGREVHVAFMIGKTNVSYVQKKIKEENEKYNDIVQGSFVDSYRNMSYKHTMSLKWAIYHCPGIKFILKTDDDVFVNGKILKNYIDSLWPSRAQKLLLCSVVPKMIAKRGYRNKWRVTPSEYSQRYFPRYCAGWAVVYSPDVAFEIYAEAQRSPYFWIDDIFMTGILAAKRNITHTDVKGPLTPIGRSKINPKDDFLFALSFPQDFKSLWTQIKNL